MITFEDIYLLMSGTDISCSHGSIFSLITTLKIMLDATE